MERPGGGGSRGGVPGREAVRPRGCGWSEGKGGMDGKEGRGDERRVKGTPKEERDAAH